MPDLTPELNEIEFQLNEAKSHLIKAREKLGELVTSHRELSGKSKWFTNLCEFAGFIDVAMDKFNVNKLRKQEEK